MERELYLASIKPKYAYRIFTGIKKYELRRWFGLRPDTNSIIIVYVSGSVKAVIGEFSVGKVLFAKPNDIWKTLSSMSKSGVGSEDYSYIKGSKYALAIEVVNPILYVKPIRLDEIRNILPGFMPPMSFRKLSIDEPLYELIIKKARENTFKKLYKNNVPISKDP